MTCGLMTLKLDKFCLACACVRECPSSMSRKHMRGSLTQDWSMKDILYPISLSGKLSSPLACGDGSCWLNRALAHRELHACLACFKLAQNMVPSTFYFLLLNNLIFSHSADQS